MLRVSCDGCGKELGKEEAHHVVKIEAFAAACPVELTEDDFDRDNLDEVAGLLAEMGASDEEFIPEPATARFRYDLCGSCRRRFLRDPLARGAAPKLHFSKN